MSFKEHFLTFYSMGRLDTPHAFCYLSRAMEPKDNLNRIMVFAGSGGQGIVLLTRTLGELLVQRGCNVISTETHGMATRGGSVVSFMKIGKYMSPYVLYGSCDIGVVLDDDELQRVQPYLKDNALLIAYSKGDIKLEAIKKKYSLPYRALNMISYGLLARYFSFEKEDAILALRDIGKCTDENLQALIAGYEEGGSLCINRD